MTAECIIEIRLQGNKQLDLVVKAPTLGDNGRIFKRKLPDIHAADLNTLRSGRASAADVDAVAGKVSRWLQYSGPKQPNPDLDLDLILGLGDKKGEPVRVVFSVR